MGSSENENLDLSDGRTLSYAVYGSPMPRTTLIYMHGFPSARFEGKLWHSACASRGVRIIVPDRPGSGLSTFQKKRTFLDWPKDIVELTDQLKIDQFYIAGVSGGSPYALACIHALPKERILGAVVCSGIYPLKLGTEGMMLMNRMLFWSAPWSPRFTAFLFEQFMGKFARSKTDPLRFAAMTEKDLQSRFHRDRDVLLDSRVFPIFVDMSREAVRQGCEGQGWEASMYGSEWGFELGQLLVGEDGVPLTIWHGTEDPNVSVKMAKRAKDLMPGSVLRLMHGEGHMSYVLRDADAILDELLGKEDSENFISIGEESN